MQSLVPNFTMCSILQIEMHHENRLFVVALISFLSVQVLVGLGLCCYVWAFSSCGVQASRCGGFPVAEHRL